MRAFLSLVYVVAVGACVTWIYTSYQRAHEPVTITKSIPSGYKKAVEPPKDVSWQKTANDAMAVAEAEAIADAKADAVSGLKAPTPAPAVTAAKKDGKPSFAANVLKNTKKWFASFSKKKAPTKVAKAKPRTQKNWKVVQRK